MIKFVIRLSIILLLPSGAIIALWLFWKRYTMRKSLTAALQAIMPKADESDIADFVPALIAAMDKYEINTASRRAPFLAQIAEESDSLWHQRDHYGTPRGEEYASGEAYEGRARLGNTEPGDGTRYKGRGLLQVTGRANYTAESAALGIDLIANPELLNEPKWAALSAAHYWSAHRLNTLADAGDMEGITRAINGGLNGYAARLEFYQRALEALV